MKYQTMKTTIHLAALSLLLLAGPAWTQGHDHAGASSKEKRAATHAEARGDVPAYFPAYEQLSEALVVDDLEAAQKAADELATQARKDDLPGIAEAAQHVAESSDINAARKHLTALNAEVVPRLRGKTGFHVMKCPMVEDGRWIQTDKPIRNPYMGQSMPRCGMVEKAG